MELAIRDQLGLENLKILRNNLIDSDQGKLFIKYGDEDLVRGEFESLKAIQATGTVMCPVPVGVVRENDSTALITNFINFKPGKKDWAMLGHQIGKNFNFSTEKFGFPLPTCCGRLAQDNQWSDKWEDFFIQHRLKPQIDRLIEKSGDRELVDFASALYCESEKLLRNRVVPPGLVHGDLWGGNWDMTTDGPIVFDPSSSFSDPEFEFGIMSMFGGWTPDFLSEYDKIVGTPMEGREKRVQLYELYHQLNHWNHFGDGYKMGAMTLIRGIIS